MTKVTNNLNEITTVIKINDAYKKSFQKALKSKTDFSLPDEIVIKEHSNIMVELNIQDLGNILNALNHKVNA